MREDRLQVAQDTEVPVGAEPHPVDEVGAGQVQILFGNGATGVLEELLRLVAEDVCRVEGG
jgi:hypothetical protein